MPDLGRSGERELHGSRDADARAAELDCRVAVLVGLLGKHHAACLAAIPQGPGYRPHPAKA